MNIATQQSVEFLPYGEFNRSERGELSRFDPPNRFKSISTGGNLSVEEQWETWIENMVKELNEVLWPSWLPAQQTWNDCTAKSGMHALTGADFYVLDQMALESSRRGLDSYPNSPVLAFDSYDHFSMFVIEDDRTRPRAREKEAFASFYRMYDRTLPQDIANLVPGLLTGFIGECLANLSHRIKSQLQRPRPYQTALTLTKKRFHYEEGRTASTPSACSGHCLQGLAAVAAIYESIVQRNIPFENVNSECLQQFAVDIGDRRVMAGIHYPSDNLCSWLILLRLADRIYVNQKVKPWIWDAISTRSRVYKSIENASKIPDGYVYVPIIERLKEAAQG